MRKFIGISVVLVVFIAGFLAHAQVQAPNRPGVQPAPFGAQGIGNLISGADVGFRVERWEGDTPVGRWVVRSEGQWVEPRTSMGPRRLSH